MIEWRVLNTVWRGMASGSTQFFDNTSKSKCVDERARSEKRKDESENQKGGKLGGMGVLAGIRDGINFAELCLFAKLETSLKRYKTRCFPQVGNFAAQIANYFEIWDDFCVFGNLERMGGWFGHG